MDNAVKAWLFDIVNAIEEIDGFFVDVPKDFYQYQQDLKTKRAVERNIEIKSETSKSLEKQPIGFSKYHRTSNYLTRGK